MTAPLRTESEIQQWFAGKSVLITGGGGYIASHLISQLSAVECRIVRAMRQERAAPACERAVIEDRICDVREARIWPELLHRIDVVFHLAAQTSTYEANRDPASDLRANVLPMLAMMLACRGLKKAPVVVSASTVTVCGLPTQLPVNEDHPEVPVTMYDLHKQMAENYLKYHSRDGLVQGATLRLANVYGPGPRSSRMDRGILNQMVARGLKGEDITVYGAGEQIRDYVYVEDVARAFLAAAVHVPALNGGHFIISRGEGHSIMNAMQLVADRVLACKARKAKVVSVATPPGLSPIEARNFIGDTRRFREATGWQPRISLAEGIDVIIGSMG
jgi:nucleoside-diphosphate-sugar epimerase